MSASLVGSEMCIRDRNDTTDPSTLAPPKLPMVLSARLLAQSPTPPNNTCLLYTSDAADDM
eukprot:13373264-Alexandrium_andersonii.AAC.1